MTEAKKKLLEMNGRFVPDKKHIVDAAWNRRAERIPLYEHGIDLRVMEAILEKPVYSVFLRGSSMAEFTEYYSRSVEFYALMGYDYVNMDQNIGGFMPGAGSLLSEKDGVISDRLSFNQYPWAEVPGIYKEKAYPHFEAFLKAFYDTKTGDPGVLGGVGNGIFECVQDMVGIVQLCYIKSDDPDLYGDIFKKQAETNLAIWTDFMKAFGSSYDVMRFGDDLGFKTSTMLSGEDIAEHVIPGYTPIVDLIHSYGKPFVFHSCGCIFNVMDDIIVKAGIDAKHSNEDTIAPLSEWVERYNSRIAIFGGVDVDVVCRGGDERLYDEIFRIYEMAKGANGFAFGSGNSIPHYVPWENYLKMIVKFRELRGD